MIAPDDFIPVAEERGLIADLFYGLLRQACSDARNWPPHLHLAVNVAPQQVQDPSLPERVLAILTETGFAPSRLETEITETALINGLEAARSTLTSLQNLGVKIALDDFGTGYSSLYHLRELQFDKLKIDKSYVTSLKQGSERAKLVDAIIQLGASLSLETTAEGIETSTNLDWLSHRAALSARAICSDARCRRRPPTIISTLWNGRSSTRNMQRPTAPPEGACRCGLIAPNQRMSQGLCE